MTRSLGWRSALPLPTASVLKHWKSGVQKRTTADAYYISEFIAVNPAKAQVVAQSRVGDNVSLSRAPGLGEDADAWWYYLESEGKPAVIRSGESDPKVADALHMSERGVAADP